MSQETPTTFFSYSRDDEAFVVELVRELKEAGASVWIDQVELRPSQVWSDVIQSALKVCSRIVLILSPASVASQNVKNEIAFALANNKPIIPVLYQDCEIPLQISGVQYIDLRNNNVRGLNALQAVLLGTSPQESDIPLVRSNDCLTGPLTISAILKGPEHLSVTDAYPTGNDGVHFVFSLFNSAAFDFLVNRLDIDLTAYTPLNLDYLIHGVGATGVRRGFRAAIRPQLGRYIARYVNGRRVGEFVTIPPGKSEGFDVEIFARTEGLYEVSVRVRGGSAGKRFDVPLDSTRRRVAFFDRSAGYMVEGFRERRLTYDEYLLEVHNCGL